MNRNKDGDMKMRKYEVIGMSCAACSQRVERAVGAVCGVESCAVSLLTNTMSIEGDAKEREIIEAVVRAGYDIRRMDGKRDYHTDNGNKALLYGPGSGLEDRETPVLKNRLVFSLIFMCLLMYFSMGGVMWGWPLPSLLSHNPAAMGILQLILTGIILVINQKFFISGFKGIVNKAPNMDTLVALGAGASMIYSIYALFALTEEMAKGNMSGAHHYLHEFYFESAAMIVTLITVGKMLEAKAKGKTTDALKGLMNLAPKMAVVLDSDGKEKEIPAGKVKKGDIFVLRAGESVPVDGIVREGHSAIDESALTGESIPADKEPGDFVYAATINKSGFLVCEALKVGENTTLSQIISMMSDVAATKAPIAKVADKVSGIFVPIVMAIAVITFFIWMIVGEGAGYALARGISVLVISCPCALGLATPVAIMVGNGIGAQNGILFKTAASLEEAGKVQIVACDKTGTITKGEPAVTDIIPFGDVTADKLLKIAYSLEKKSEHPLAKAIIAYGKENLLSEAETGYDKENPTSHAAIPETDRFEVMPGNGVKGKINNQEVLGGSLRFISNKIELQDSIKKLAEDLALEGKTPLFFMEENTLLGIIAVADSLKEDSVQAIKELKAMGIYVVMVTGDNEKTAKAIGKEVMIDEVIAEVLPDGKEKVISDLQKKGKVAMVGDGINDALALTKADTGIAIGAGSDIAIDAADVVLMKSRLSDVPATIRLSRQTKRNIHQNLFWAFFYNIIGIPLAAGLWIPIFGWEMNPMFGALAMSLSSFCVVSNALRLNFFDIKSDKKDKKRKSMIIIKHENQMKLQEITKTKIEREEEKMSCKRVKMVIEGMMCAHCEASVKKALESLEHVSEAVVSHEEGTAMVTLEEETDNLLLKKAVEDKDYKVISIM